MYIDRKELIQEERLRELIRKSIKTISHKKTLEEEKSLREQKQLRSYIIKLVEAEKALVAPHPSTGINVLEDLLKKIIPQIEVEYKKLTTSHEQRASFQTHIVNAIQNSLAPTRASEKAGTDEEEKKAIDIDLHEMTTMQQALNKSSDKENIVQAAEWKSALGKLGIGQSVKFRIKNHGTVLVMSMTRKKDNTFSLSNMEFRHVMDLSDEEAVNYIKNVDKFEILNFNQKEPSKLNEVDDIEMEVGDKIENDATESSEFIDIDGTAPTDPAAEKADAFSVEGEDETGRNMAFKAFERVETSIIDAYAILSNDEDRELFYDYLLTNMKLYFDKFEDELTSILPEPTTDEYESEKDQQDFSAEEEFTDEEDLTL